MKQWLVSLAFWMGLYLYVEAVATNVIHEYGLSDARVWVPGLLGIVGLSVWKVWSEV